MNWRDVLPGSRFELWILRIGFVIGAMAMGSVMTFLYLRNDFERGMYYMQKVYTTPGMVERSIITSTKNTK